MTQASIDVKLQPVLLLNVLYCTAEGFIKKRQALMAKKKSKMFVKAMTSSICSTKMMEVNWFKF